MESFLYLSEERYEIEERPCRPFHSALHSVRKPQAKPWKKPVAPPVPVPTRVYKVDSINFKEVVQQLTGASASGRLRRAAPPPLDLATIPSPMPMPMSQPLPRLPSPSCGNAILVPETLETAKPWMLSDTSLSLCSPGSLELGLSPTSFMWSCLPILSPGTLSIF